MPATKRGVYHNLRESKYVVSNTEITFFFSSEYVLNKFLNGYKKNRDTHKYRLGNLLKDTPYNMDVVADICFYQKIEQRGFFVKFKNVSLKKDDLYKYALRKLTDENTLDWERVKYGKDQD